MLAEDGSMAWFENELVIRCMDKVAVEVDGYKVAFKYDVTVEVGIYRKWRAAVLLKGGTAARFFRSVLAAIPHLCCIFIR